MNFIIVYLWFLESFD